MFTYDEFVAKAKLYNLRAASADANDERDLWLTLAFEFLLRAPLSRVSPVLLAVPEGDSILYAAGVAVPAKNVKSIPVKSVLERLQKVDAKFGSDRAKQALEVVNLRNGELHSSSPVFAGARREDWLPKLLEVSEAICEHLGLDVGDLMDSEILEEARTYQETALGETRGLVTQKLQSSRQFVDKLTSVEVSQRTDLIPPFVKMVECPACGHVALHLGVGSPRTQRSQYDEESGEILYTLVQVVTSATCYVCGLALDSTAQVVAAGVDRLVKREVSEDRYEGWRDAIGQSELQQELEDMMEHMSYGEEYGND